MNHIDTGRVIDEVRIRRCLWDPADDFYKNKDAKNKAWEEIGKELCGENFNTDLDKQIRHRWKSARDNYFRTKGNMRNTPSGSAAKHKKTSMVPNITLLFLVMALTSVAAQTFQYSRGWTNGKRDGHKRDELKDVASSLERILSPCQMNKLKYVLEGKPISDRLFGPCDYLDEDLDSQSKRYKAERSQDPLFEAFQ